MQEVYMHWSILSESFGYFFHHCLFAYMHTLSPTCWNLSKQLVQTHTCTHRAQKIRNIGLIIRGNFPKIRCTWYISLVYWGWLHYLGGRAVSAIERQGGRTAPEEFKRQSKYIICTSFTVGVIVIHQEKLDSAILLKVSLVQLFVCFSFYCS